MKKYILTIIATFSVAGVASAQTCTDPVGYVTCDVSNGDGNISLVAPTLVNGPEYSGVVASSSGTTINVDNSPFTANEFDTVVPGKYSYCVEITSGTNEGKWSHVVTNSAGALTCADSTFVAAATAGSTISVRRHVTIADFFGDENEVGLGEGTSVTNSDEIQIQQQDGNVDVFFYSSLTGLDGWRDSIYADASSFPIYPDQGVVIKSKGNTTSNYVFAGHVKTTATEIVLKPGVNITPSIYPIGEGLADSGLDVIGSGTSVSNSDEVQIYDGTGNVNVYFNSTLSGLDGWRDSLYTDASNTEIDSGDSVVIKIKGSSDIVATVPAPVISN